jgi:hypothetical protein
LGVGGKPTVEFAAVNVQIVNGSTHTNTVNGTGNLVAGYDESAGTQSGSHDLILGEQQTDRGYGDILGGIGNAANGAHVTAFGDRNTVSGMGSSVSGRA